MIRIIDLESPTTLRGILACPIRLVPRPRPSFSPMAAAVWAAALVLSHSPAHALPIEIPVASESDDGEEVNRSVWDPDPWHLTLGHEADGTIREVGLRYLVPQLSAGDSVLFARLRFCSKGGELSDSLIYRITGAAEASPAPCSQERRPSQLPQTRARVTTAIREPWSCAGGNTIFYYSEDISGILNEILAVPGWGAEMAAVIFCLGDSSDLRPASDFVEFSDFHPDAWTVTLEICPTLDEAFACHERLGRPTDTSVALRFLPLVPMEVFVEYGADGGWVPTPHQVAPAGVSCEITVDGLQGDATYTCRLRYRREGREEEFRTGPNHDFHTQRFPESPFTFTVTADEHTWNCYEYAPDLQPCEALYRRTLANAAADAPDFHFSLGDFSMTAFAYTMADARDRYLLQRRLLDSLLPSTPFYLVLGNHEGELGWLRAQGDSIPFRAERARLEMIPNPAPDRFYQSCPDSAQSGGGTRQSYYAWEWGDALFVVLDPFWYTTIRPHHNPQGEGGGWDWTLGLEQYNWLYDVLSGSHRRWKIVLLHHLTGGIEYRHDSYGRGGIEVAKYRVAQRPSFEWGGENEDGQNMFSLYRPGWLHGPIHDLLRQTGANLVIHGHDHLCAFQDLDGIAYVLCPQPGDAWYTYGTLIYSGYTNGVILPNSGHLRFHVSAEALTVDYVRSYLDGDGPNGHVQYTYTVPGSISGIEADAGISPGLRIVPNPTTGSTARIWLSTGTSIPGRGNAAGATDAELQVFDAAGRLCRRLRSNQSGAVDWDLRDTEGRAVSSGVYWCRAPVGGGQASKRLLVVR